MIKRKNQPRQDVTPPSLKRMSDTEYAAYFEAFESIKNDYQVLCLIGDKLREVETNGRGLTTIEGQEESGHDELPASVGDRSPWEVCAPLMQLDRNEVLLCKRVCEHGYEYAVIDHTSAASAYTMARGPVDVLCTGQNPRQVLRDYLRSERETLQLMVNDITANVRLLIAERFPKQDLRRVVNELTRMCKNVARLGISETPREIAGEAQQIKRGVRV